MYEEFKYQQVQSRDICESQRNKITNELSIGKGVEKMQNEVHNYLEAMEMLKTKE